MEKEFDWSQFSTGIEIKHPISKIFAYWASSEGLEQWFLASSTTQREGRDLAKATGFRPGDQFEWKWPRGETVAGQIIDIKRDRLLSFSFGKTASGQDVIVKVMFSGDNSLTKITIEQKNMDTTEHAKVAWHMDCHMGWALHLKEMQIGLEHGINLTHLLNRSLI